NVGMRAGGAVGAPEVKMTRQPTGVRLAGFTRTSFGGIVSTMPHAHDRRATRFWIVVLFTSWALVSGLGWSIGAQARPRARDLGVPFSGTPGPLNAITDVAGVEVGHVTLIEGSGRVVVGKGPVRTGVTAILPKGKVWEPVFAGWFAGNGFGEMTGAPWVVEGGVLGGPVMMT